jgi:hypothetical protein
MGPGEDVFERYGHAALCVFDDPGADGRCFNYGTADFRDPVKLVTTFLRGQARFWVSVSTADRMMAYYQREDRTLYVQRLPLTDVQARALAARLDHEALPENRYYVYEHFRDNCTTRLRDHMDDVLDGALRADTQVPYGPTWRDMVRHGFSAAPEMLALAEILPGRSADRHPTTWEAMFHPDVLREVVRERLGVTPEVVYERQGPSLVGPAYDGRKLLVWLALALAAIAGGLVASGRRVPARVGLVLAGVVLGLLAVLVDVMSLYCRLIDLRMNEVALVLLPTDFLLLGLRGHTLRRYLDVRLVGLAIVVVLGWAGARVQPLGPLIVLAGLPLACVRAALVDRLPWATPWPWVRRRGARPAPTSARP